MGLHPSAKVYNHWNVNSFGNEPSPINLFHSFETSSQPTMDVHVVSKLDNRQHATIQVPGATGPLKPSSIRVRTAILGLTSNNLTYAMEARSSDGGMHTLFQTLAKPPMTTNPGV
jgi:hypothetical protein